MDGPKLSLMQHEYDSVPKPAAQRLQRLGERLEVGHRTVERGVLDCAGVRFNTHFRDVPYIMFGFETCQLGAS